MLNEQCWDEVYKQSDPNLAFTMFIEKLQIKYNKVFPIITRVIPNSKINGWFDSELRSLQKDKRVSYLRLLRKSDVQSKIAHRKIKNHHERVIKTKKCHFFKKRLDTCRSNLKHTWGGYYRILCVSERFLSLILLGGEILRAAAEITSSQSWDYRLHSQKEQLLGEAECLANCSVCIGLL